MIRGEHSIQGFVMAYLSLNAYYLTAPEAELAHGYCDIYLLPDKQRYPDTAHSYIIELKYLAEKTASKQEQSQARLSYAERERARRSQDGDAAAAKQWADGVEQIRRYATDRKVALMGAGTTLHLVIMQVRGCELVRMEETAR